MHIEIKLTIDEAKEILINNFKTQYPDHNMTCDISSYAGVVIEITKNTKVEGEQS